MKKWSALLLLAALALLLAGCVQDWAGRATPAGSTIVVPTLTPAAPTGLPPTAALTPAPPTATAEPPTATSAPPTLTPAPPTPTSAPPTRTLTPAPAAARLQFPAGGTTLVAEGVARPGAPSLFVLRASAGQLMDVQVSLAMAQAELAIWGADGTTLKRASDGRLWWRGTLPSTQDYFLQVDALGGERGFSLSIGIPVRISFASGGDLVPGGRLARSGNPRPVCAKGLGRADDGGGD